MSDNKEIPRFQYPLLLAKKFIDDFDVALTHYNHAEQIELTEHILQVVKLIGEYATTNEEVHHEKFQALEDELLIKYRTKIKPYERGQFGKYFWFSTVIVEKEIISPETYNAMQPEEQRLTVDEVKRFVHVTQNTLRQQRHYLYLEETEQAEQELNLGDNDNDEPDKEITKSRQLLAIYYFLKAAFAVQHAATNSISAVAKFAHLMTGTKFTTLQNSDIYKKYQRMPNYKKGSYLIKDLKFIRPYFEELDMKEALEMIDTELKLEIKKLPAIERKKFKDNI